MPSAKQQPSNIKHGSGILYKTQRILMDVDSRGEVNHICLVYFLGGAPVQQV